MVRPDLCTTHSEESGTLSVQWLNDGTVTDMVQSHAYAVTRRGAFQHMIDMYTMRVPGTTRVLLFLRPGPDCGLNDQDANGHCMSPCSIDAPTWSASFQSLRSGTTAFMLEPATAMWVTCFAERVLVLLIHVV